MKTNIFHFIGSLNDGGAETLVKDYCLLIDKTTFNSKVITLHNTIDSSNKKILESNGIEILPIYRKWNILTKIFHRVFGSIYVPIKFKRIINKYTPNIIHTHLRLLHHVHHAVKNKTNIKLFYTCHNLPNKFFGNKDNKEYFACKSLITTHGLQLIALHDEMKQKLNQMFDVNNTVVIRNAINFKRFTELEETKNDIRHSLGIPCDSFVVGHIGRFAEQKNHKFLIDVFYQLQKTKQNSFLILVGHGKLENEIKEKINLLGLTDKTLILSHRSDIPRLLKSMDVFVFPSIFEGLGIVLIEAQAMKIRCIVADTIPLEAFLSENIVSESLDAPIEKWVYLIANDKIKNNIYGDISKYDMNLEMKRLEKLYLGDLND